MFRKMILGLVAAVSVMSYSFGASAQTTTASRLKGYIVLQVESKGQAWYVNPANAQRYYLKDGTTALNTFQGLALGVNETNFDRLNTDPTSALRTRLAGRVIMRVKDRGQTYYVCPINKQVLPFTTASDVFNIMKTCHLGISDINLAKITIAPSSLNPDNTSGPIGT